MGVVQDQDARCSGIQLIDECSARIRCRLQIEQPGNQSQHIGLAAQALSELLAAAGGIRAKQRGQLIQEAGNATAPRSGDRSHHGAAVLPAFDDSGQCFQFTGPGHEACIASSEWIGGKASAEFALALQRLSQRPYGLLRGGCQTALTAELGRQTGPESAAKVS